MMKYPRTQGMLALLCAGLFLNTLCPSGAEARIGERRDSLERRLTSAGGIVYRDDATEANRRNGMPYMRFMELMPSSVDVRVYFKTADGRRPTSSELEEKRMAVGWDLHVVYLGGKSVIEVYKRSQGISEFEMNHLLALHAGGSYWKKVEKADKEEIESAFDFDMVRDDGRVRAKKLGGDAVLFVDAELDTRLAQTHTGDLQEKAPISVEGF